jgi:tRNA threonylcarbamoyladenosine biosynthesis protein TsaE
MISDEFPASLVTLVSDSADQTRAVAARLAVLLRPGDMVALRGDLGAGKTTFVQGLARALGVAGPVNSPTFTLLHEHVTDGTAGAAPSLLFHWDVYRLSGLDDLADLGWHDYLRANRITLVEWADRIEAALPDERLDVLLEEAAASSSEGDDDGDDNDDNLERSPRRITLIGRGRRWSDLAAQWPRTTAAAC